MKKITALIPILAVAFCSHAQLEIVNISDGVIAGTKNSAGDIAIFKGIPFAAPPVDEYRWRPPQPVVPWRGIKDCSRFSASPMQNKPVPFMMYTAEYLVPESPMSEDCLYLNVWTGATSAQEKRPVFVWIYGGGFVSGGSACAIYDGEALAKKGVVFVSINYRVGVFGFLAHPELTQESKGKSSGNYALLDQLAALQWVQQNIAAFGGDPGCVTIAGQSAGAFSVNALVASPLAKGLFHRAIAHSGGMFNADGRAITLQQAEANGQQLMQTMKVGSIAALRELPAEEIQNAAGAFTASPVIDGYVLPEPVYNIFSKGNHNDVPLLTGWNGDDGFPQQTTPAPEQYKADAAKQYGPLADAFLRAFPGNTTEAIKRSQFALNCDNLFAWQNYTWATMQATHGKQKAYLYQFNHVSPSQETYGAFHSSEICYALHTLHTWKLPFTDKDRRLEEIMSTMWVNFAATGDPNGKGVSVWTPFDPKHPTVLLLDADATTMQPIAAQAEFDFIDRYQQQLRKGK